MIFQLYSSASAHLTAVRSEVVDKIKLLNEELVLIDSHLEEQKEKKSEVRISSFS